MTRRFAGLPVWAPGDVIDGLRAVLGWTDEAVGVMAALPQRISGLLDAVQTLVSRFDALADRIDGVADRAEGTLRRADDVASAAGAVITRTGTAVDEAAGVTTRALGVVDRAANATDGACAVVERAATTTDHAHDVVERVAALGGDAADLLDTYAPIARQAAPLARRFVTELSADELRAAIRLLDHLPALTEHMISDIMPILATLDRVGPDVRELLEVLKEVRQAIIGIPGFAYLRRRGEREEQDGR